MGALPDLLPDPDVGAGLALDLALDLAVGWVAGAPGTESPVIAWPAVREEMVLTSRNVTAPAAPASASSSAVRRRQPLGQAGRPPRLRISSGRP